MKTSATQRHVHTASEKSINGPVRQHGITSNMVDRRLVFDMLFCALDKQNEEAEIAE